MAVSVKNSTDEFKLRAMIVVFDDAVVHDSDFVRKMRGALR